MILRLYLVRVWIYPQDQITLNFYTRAENDAQAMNKVLKEYYQIQVKSGNDPEAYHCEAKWIDSDAIWID